MLGEGGTSPGLSRPERKAIQKQGLVDAVALRPGALITWLGNDEPALLDCLHDEPDGTVWAFVTLPDGWGAINAKYVTVVRTL